MTIEFDRKKACLTGLLTATIALSSLAPHANAKNDGGDAASESEVPFISETKVIAPRQVGEFQLDGSRRYDEEDKFGGVSFRYLHPDYPQVRIDLFVYPAGEREVEALLDTGMRDFLASMKPAIDAGMYRNLNEGNTVEFDLDLSSKEPQAGNNPSTEGSTSGETDEKRAKKQEKDATASTRNALIAQLLKAGRHIDGRRMSLSYDYHVDVPDEWFPVRSRTYMFYRQLYYFKGRITAATSQIDEAAYDALTDRAMRELVPAVQAYNIGGCSKNMIYVNVDAPKETTSDQMMRGIVDIQARNTRNNCHGAADQKELAELTRNAVVESFVYSVTDWKAK